MEKAFAVQCLSRYLPPLKGYEVMRFYTTYRLLPVIKESVVVIGSPGSGAFYDESDPGFEKPENKKKMTLIRQGRRDCLYLDSIFKVPSPLHPPPQPLYVKLTYRNSLFVIREFHFIIFSLGLYILTVLKIKDLILWRFL